MTTLQGIAIISWIALPTVMYGGYSLLSLALRSNRLTPFQATFFRAGHAHAGVLLVLSLVFYLFLERTTLPPFVQNTTAAAFFLGILAQSGGFFLHMGVGKPNQSSIGTTITTIGALVLALCIAVLIYGLIAAPLA